MTTKESFPPGTTAASRPWPWLIFGAALLFRLFAFFDLRSSVFLFAPYGDAKWFDQWALTIAAGDLVGAGAFYVEALYPYLLAAVYKIAGHHPAFVLFLQHVVGAVSCVLVYRLTKRVFDGRAAVFAGFLAAGYGGFPFYEAQLLKETGAILLLLAAALVFLRAATDGRLTLWFAGGALTGVTVLLRGNVQLYVPLLAAWAWWVARRTASPAEKRTRPWLAGLCVAGGALLGVLPATAHNWLASRDFVLSTYSAGVNFYMGNNPRANGMFVSLKEGREGPPMEEQDAVGLAEAAEGRKLKPSEVSRYWMRRGLSFVADDPGVFLKLVLVRFMLIWNAQEIPDYLDLREVSKFHWYLQIPGFTFGAAAALGLFGIGLAFRARRADPGVWLVLLYVLGTVFSAMLFHVLGRYRIVMVPFVIVFAGVALEWLWRTVSRKEWNALGAAAPGLLAAAFVNVAWTRPYTPGVSYQTAAHLLAAKGDDARAEDLLERAVVESRGSHLPLGLLARCYAKVGKTRKALDTFRAYEAALQRLNDPAKDGLVFEARTEIAGLLTKLGETDQARELLQSTAAQSPGDLESRLALANKMKKAGMLPEAEAAYREALAVDPRHLLALNNLANILRDRGSYEEAEALYDRALAVQPNHPTILKNKALLAERRAAAPAKKPAARPKKP